MVHASIVSIRRCVGCQGSRGGVARIASSDSASTTCTTRCSSSSGPPRITKPASTRPFMNDACSGQARLLLHGPGRVPGRSRATEDDEKHHWSVRPGISACSIVVSIVVLHPGLCELQCVLIAPLRHQVEVVV